MSYAFLGGVFYLLGGFIVWWKHFGRFEDKDLTAMFRAADNDSTKAPATATAFAVAIVWPLALCDVLQARVFFNEAAERKRYMFGVRTLQQDVSDRFRNVLTKDMRRVHKRFTKRGLPLSPAIPD